MPSSRKSVWDTALNLLAGRDFSRTEMAERLARRGFDEAETAATLDKLERYGYVVNTGADHARLEQMAAQYLAKKKNPANPAAFRSLEAFLLRKGFDPELVAAHLEHMTAAARGAQGEGTS